MSKNKSFFNKIGKAFTNIFVKDKQKKPMPQVYQYGQRHSYNTLGEVDYMKYPILNTYLYSPVLGVPRNYNPYVLRTLSKSNWVRQCLNVIKKTIQNTKWEIVPVDSEKPLKYENIKKNIEYFFRTPTINELTIDEINEMLIDDYYTIGDCFLCKIFNEDLYTTKNVNLVCRDWKLEKDKFNNGILESRKYNKIMPVSVLEKKSISKAVKNNKIGLFDVRPVDAASMLVNIDRYGNMPFDKPSFYQYSFKNPRMSSPKPFFKREIIWKRNTPLTYEVYGFSPIISIMMVLETLIAGTRDNKLRFENNSMPDGVLTYLSDNSDEIKEVTNVFKNKLKNNPHRLLVLPNEHKFTMLNLTNRDMEWLDGQKFYQKLVMSMFNVTGEELGFTENSNRSISQGMSRVFVRNTVIPTFKLLESIWNKVITEFYPEDVIPEVVFKFFYEDKFEEQLRIDNNMKLLKNGVKSINEVRREEGMDKVEWGEGDPRKNKGNFLSTNDVIRTGDKENSLNEDNKKSWYDFNNFITNYVQKNIKSNPVQPSEYKGLMKYTNELLNFMEKEYLKIINKGLKLQDTISELNKINNNIGFTNIPGYKKSITEIYEKGVDNVEENLNINIFLDKSGLLDSFSKQLVYGYTLPDGSRWNGFKGLSDNIKQKTINIFTKGLKKGEGIKKISSKVRKLLDNSRYHSIMIARTESSRILHSTELLALQKTDYKIVKEWSAKLDERTGEDSKRLNGLKVGLNELFTDPGTGETYYSPPHRPNDRCSIIYKVLNDKNKLNKSFKSSLKKVI